MFVIYFFDNGEKIIFCDVGQGDGMLVQRGMKQLVVDTGPENGKMLACLGKYMPFWDKKIDGLIVTHKDADHRGGFDIVNKYYKIENIFEVEDLKYEDKIRLGQVELKVLNSGPINDNDGSVVIELSWNNKKALLLADTTVKTQNKLLWRKLLQKKYDLVKISHHGSRDSYNEELIMETRPFMAIISVGKNSYGHPAREVISSLEGLGVQIKRTDTEGNIIVN